jgi:hypothetical protein
VGSNRILALKILDGTIDQDWPFGEVFNEDQDQISIYLGEEVPFENADGRFLIQKDYKVAGEVWQVHKGDADPFPSCPHAHCVGGKQRFIGLKLHLGSRELFDGRKSIGLYLPRKPFERLIKLIQPKFPNINLPLTMP